MILNQWRSGLTAWLQSKMAVDSWELRNPTVFNTTNAFIPPLQNIRYSDDGVGTATATQDIYLTTRYSADILYKDLPLADKEQQFITLCRKLSTGFKDIAPLEDLEVLSVEDGIQVTEYGDTLADWLVTMVLSLRISWIPEPTLLPGEVSTPLPVPITTVDTGLYTQKLTSTDPRNPTTRDKYGQMKVEVD